MKIAGVRFRENWKVYDFDATGMELAVGDEVIVDSDRGQGYARVVRLREGEAPPAPEEAEEKKRPRQKEEEEEIEIDIDDVLAEAPLPERKPSRGGLRRVLRKATPEDNAREAKNREREAEAFRACQELVAGRDLPMKLIRVDYAFDASRATFFFFSETRVDFRDLVKDLAHKLRCRIEMRQIGVRDVARMIGGYGPCGRSLCCATFLKGFEPVSIRMAKKQEMVLNPAKISGVCGRLLCCLSYEYGIYDDIKKDVAGMKAEAERSRKEADELRTAEARREEEERRREDEKRRQEEERKRQESRQDRQRGDQKDRRGKERPKDRQERKGQPEQERKGQPEQERKGQPEQERKGQPQQERVREGQPAGAQQAGQPPQQAPEEKSGKRRRRRWRKRKKGQAGGEQSGPAGPADQGE